MQNDEVVMASKEFYDLLSSTTKSEKTPLEDVVVHYGNKNFRCSINSIKISEYSVELELKTTSKDSLELIVHGIESSLRIPSLLPHIKKSTITGIELDAYSNIKLTASIIP